MTETNTDITYYQVTVAARMVGIAPARVRQYLEIGLLQPAHVENGVALLGPAELARLRRIRRLSTDLGLNRPGVEVVVRLLDQIAVLRARLDQLPETPDQPSSE